MGKYHSCERPFEKSSQEARIKETSILEEAVTRFLQIVFW